MQKYASFSQKMGAYSVLYVEDDHAVRSYIVEFLRRYCKEVYECDSAEKARELYQKHKPDILLLDINLGGMSGIEFATIVRKENKEVRILMATAYTNKEFMLQAIELGLTRYLVKPLINDDLVQALEKCSDELETTHQIILAKNHIYNKNLAVVFKGEERIELRKKEIDLLEFFMAHEGEVLRYEILEQSIWQNEPMTRDAIRSQIRNIRKKLGLDLFENVSGVGYRFRRLD